jgi:hypothetical protein
MHRSVEITTSRQQICTGDQSIVNFLKFVSRTIAYGIKTTLLTGDNDISHCPAILPAFWSKL